MPVFTAIDDRGYTLIGIVEAMEKNILKELLSEVKKRGLISKEFVNAKILSSLGMEIK